MSKKVEIQSEKDRILTVLAQEDRYMTPNEIMESTGLNLKPHALGIRTQNLCPLSFIDVPKRLYIEGLLGVYELNDVALIKEIFLWAYRRSAPLLSDSMIA